MLLFSSNFSTRDTYIFNCSLDVSLDQSFWSLEISVENDQDTG